MKDNLVSNRTTRQNLREIYSNVLLLSPFVERKFYEGQSFGFWSKFRVAKKNKSYQYINIEYPSVPHKSVLIISSTQEPLFLVPKIRQFNINLLDQHKSVCSTHQSYTNPSVPHIRLTNLPDRFVSIWRICVELTDWCWTDMWNFRMCWTDVWNWQMCWTCGFVWNWRILEAE